MQTATLPAGTNAARTTARESTDRARLRAWLGVVMLAIFALVVVGGVTRLTNSGLSITEWKPIHGVIPPLSQAEWQEEFQRYQQIPEYREINSDMTLEGFKYIFWWEWAHRLLARSVGVLFAVPLIAFWLSGRIAPRLRLPLVGILALGGLQGFIGWWMVSSGLVDRTDVSQYRLATHLTLACIIFASIAWVARGLGRACADPAPTRGSVYVGGLITLLVLVQIYLGGLVAGLDAGYSYNTWPLMDGTIIPGGLFPIEPVWRNFFENPKLVQLTHRMSAYLVWTIVLIHMIAARRIAPGTSHARRATILFGLVSLQAAIGITTLLLQVPLHWGLLHQAGAIVVLGFAVMHWRALAGVYPQASRATGAADKPVLARA